MQTCLYIGCCTACFYASDRGPGVPLYSIILTERFSNCSMSHKTLVSDMYNCTCDCVLSHWVLYSNKGSEHTAPLPAYCVNNSLLHIQRLAKTDY